jgi:integrase
MSHPQYKPFEHLSENWRRCIDQFLSDVESKSGSAKSAKTYKNHLGEFFSSHSDPNAVTRGDVASWLSAPRTRKGHEGEAISPSTRNGRRVTLSRFYAAASEFEIDADGTPLFQKASPVRGYHDVQVSRVHKSMSPDQLARFFAAIDTTTIKGKRDYCLYSCYLVTCRRRSELARLRVCDLEETVLIDGDQRRRGICFTFFGKGKSRVADSQELASFLYDLLTDYWRAAGRYPPKPSDPLFTPVFHGQARGEHTQLCGSWINVQFRAYCKKALLPESLTLHSLRHAGARARVESGATLKQVQTILRHEHISTTERYVESITTAQDTGLAGLTQHLPFLLPTKLT